MALNHAFASESIAEDEGLDILTNTFDSSAYDAIVVFTKHEGAVTTIVVTDNKSTSYTPLTKESHTNGDLHAQLHWGIIGTPGTGHQVTMTNGASRAFQHVAAWLINSNTGATIELDVQSVAEGSSSTPDAGSLVTSAAAILIMGAGGYALQTFTAGTGWTENGADDKNNALQSRAEASSGTFDPSGTFTASADWAAVSAAFREQAAAGSILRLVARDMANIADMKDMRG